MGTDSLDNQDVRNPLPLSGPVAAALRRHDFRTKPDPQTHAPSAPAGAAPVSLDALHAAFARGLAVSLSQHLQTPVEVLPLRTEQMAYRDFVLSLDPASCLAVLRVDPPGAQACFDLPLSVIFPMIDRLLAGEYRADSADTEADDSSGSVHPAPPRRGLRGMTQIEQGLALQIVERAAGRLADSWSVAVDVSVSEQSLESSPAALRLMPGEESVSVTRFDLRLAHRGGGEGGTMSLCLPTPVVRYLHDGSVAPSIGRENAGGPARGQRSASESSCDSRGRANLRRNVLDAAVELRAILAETKIRLTDALSMTCGDFITFDAPAGGGASPSAVLRIAGAPDLTGRLVALDGKRAIRLESPRLESPRLDQQPDCQPDQHLDPQPNRQSRPQRGPRRDADHEDRPS